MLALLIILLLTGFIQKANGYEPLTETEVEKWLGSVTFEELIDFVIKYDFVENTTPIVEFPNYIVVLHKRDIYIKYQDKMKVKIGHLEYGFEFEDKVYEKFVPRKKDIKKIGISFGAGTLVGIILMVLIL